MAKYALVASDRARGGFDVLRDGVLVARVFEDPSLHGGRLRYDGAVAFVSLTPVRWSGELPDEAKDIPQHSRPCHLAYDFVSSHQRAVDALPEVEEHVEALLAWRASRAP